MLPVLLTIGPFKLYSFGIFLLLAWLGFSFVLWKSLRNEAVDEEHIFDLTFYSTVIAFIAARLGYVFLNLQLFSDTMLKIAAIWVQPGLSLYAGLIAAGVCLLFCSKRYKVRFAYILDGLAFALPIALFFGKIGSLLDGSEIGIQTPLAWGVRYIGQTGTRHPVQVYEMIVLLILFFFATLIRYWSIKKKWPYGIVGIWFFFFYGITMFCIEYLKESSVYLASLRVNQWILLALFAESLGALYVRGGGREKILPVITKIKGGIYATFTAIRSRKSSRKNLEGEKTT